jgi:hypothetical protein
LKWWWCGPFALGLIFSPPLALIAKNGDFESPSLLSPHSWNIPKFEHLGYFENEKYKFIYE